MVSRKIGELSSCFKTCNDCLAVAKVFQLALIDRDRLTTLLVKRPNLGVYVRTRSPAASPYFSLKKTLYCGHPVWCHDKFPATQTDNTCRWAHT